MKFLILFFALFAIAAAGFVRRCGVGEPTYLQQPQELEDGYGVGFEGGFGDQQRQQGGFGDQRQQQGGFGDQQINKRK